jgi:hypothetical protein
MSTSENELDASTVSRDEEKNSGMLGGRWSACGSEVAINKRDGGDYDSSAEQVIIAPSPHRQGGDHSPPFPSCAKHLSAGVHSLPEGYSTCV